MKDKKIYIASGLLRITLGSIFLWAFLDKLFGFGFSTIPEKSWLAGNSPTFVFLSNNKGVFSSWFQSLAGSGLVDWLFMMGLLGIGLALIFGIGMKIAVYSGSLLMFLMWLASLPLKNHPFVDDHIIYILVLWVLYFLEAGKHFGFGNWWSRTKLVKKMPFLQ